MFAIRARFVASAFALTVSVVAPGCSNRPPSPVAPAAQPKPAIVQAGDPVLRSRAAEVSPEQLASPEFKALVDRMIATMRAAPGVGLAAPQIGVPLRVIVLEDRDEYTAKLTAEERAERERAPFGVRVFVNPKLSTVGTQNATFFEGCLSVNGYVGLTPRALEVEISGLDEHGAPQTWHVRGWPARILQHEVDHLDGTLYVDRMLTRSFITGEQAKQRFAKRPIAEILDALR